MEDAIVREKLGKKWLGRWKMELIERDNLGWRDLAEELGFASLEPTGSPRSAFGSAWQRRDDEQAAAKQIEESLSGLSSSESAGTDGPKESQS